MLAWVWLVELFSIQYSYFFMLTALILILLITNLMEKLLQKCFKITNLLNIPFIKTIILFFFILLLFLVKFHNKFSPYIFFMYGGLFISAWFFSVFDYFKIKKS